MKINIPDNLSKDNIKKPLIDNKDKISKWLSKEGDISTYNSNGVIVSFLLCALLVVGLMLSLFTTTWNSQESETADEFTETVDVKIVSADKQSSNSGETKYKVVLEYLDEEYKFDDESIYLKCKNMVNAEVDGELTITITEDGDISYEITGLVDN